jgi:predicted small metal-binding protein
MMKFECKDMGMECDYVAAAATKEEVIDMAMAHAVEAHGDMLKDLSPEQTEVMNAQLESVIKAEDEAEEIGKEEAAGDEEIVADDDEEDVEIEVEEIEEEDVIGDETMIASDDEAEIEQIEEKSTEAV